jgi:hypothetical protein
MTINPKTDIAMKPENKDLRNIETNNSPQQPAGSTGSRAGLAVPAHSGRETPAAARNSPGFSRPLFVITGVVLCMGLASCVVPYDSYGGNTATVTTYRPGYRINSLPGGYRSETISGSTYYYHDGHYYRQASGGYVVVDAPRNSRYHDDYGRRQQIHQPDRLYRESPDRHDGRYERGEVITRLPAGYRQVNQRGNTYYQVGDRYYRRQKDRSYVIVSNPF